MKVLVTGAAGQLGQALQRSAPAGVDLVALDRAGLDLADPLAIDRVVAHQQPALIINAAAYTAVDKAESEPVLAYRLNSEAPAALAAAATRHGARLLHVSTDFVFDGRNPDPYRPDHPTAPLGVYGASKQAGEAAVLAADPGALIVRTAWVYAAHGNNFVKTMLRLMTERPEVRVVADQVGTPTHALSLAHALWALAASQASGPWHFTDAGVASWYDFAVAIQEEALALGLLRQAVPVQPITTADFPTPARRPAYSVLDKTATTALIGAAAHWRVELRAMLAMLKDQTDG